MARSTANCRQQGKKQCFLGHFDCTKEETSPFDLIFSGKNRFCADLSKQVTFRRGWLGVRGHFAGDSGKSGKYEV